MANVLGSHAGVANINTQDSRVTTLPTGWVAFDQGNTIGYEILQNASNTNPITFTPTKVTNSLDVYYYDGAGYSPIFAKGGVAGETDSSPVNVAATGSLTIKKATFTCDNTSVWKISGNGTSGVLIFGFSAYNSGEKEVSLLNIGCGSRRADQILSTGNNWKSIPSITASTSALLSPLVIYSYGLNDCATSGILESTLFTSINTVVSALISAGTDVLLVIPPPVATGVNVHSASYPNLVAAYKRVAITHGIAYINLPARWVSNQISYPLGYYRAESDLHPSTIGYQDIAEAISSFFLNL